MSRVGLSLSLALLIVLSASAMGQPDVAGRRAKSRSFHLPPVGSLLPDVTVYDEQGAEFSTRQLQGHYTVLVFGCLT